MTSTQLLADFAADIVRRYALMATDLVVEVGSGDGQLLQAVRALGPRAVGIEPDVRAATRAWAVGADTLAANFTPEVAAFLHSRYGPARVVVTRTVQPVGDHLSAFLATAGRCLAPGGVIAIHSGGAGAIIEVRPDMVVARAA